jgi:hypothetical protein
MYKVTMEYKMDTKKEKKARKREKRKESSSRIMSIAGVGTE